MSHGPTGCEKHGTGRCGDNWGRPMSSSGRLSADIIMMTQILFHSGWGQRGIFSKLAIPNAKTVTTRFIFLSFYNSLPYCYFLPSSKNSGRTINEILLTIK